MEEKRYLKVFNNQEEYEAQKDEVMGVPHVILLEDTKEVVYKPLTETEEDEIDYSLEFFTLEALEDGVLDFTLGSGAIDDNTLYYSVNDSDWESFVYDEDLGGTQKIVNVQQNDKVKIKAQKQVKKYSNVGRFNISNPFNAYGNAMSLIYGDNFEGQTSLEGYSSCFQELLQYSNIVSAENLILPATTLAEGCYGSMFKNCTNLTTAPQLPTTTLASYCYTRMFGNCTSLETAPQLPATTLAEGCYSNMFYGTNVLPDWSNIDFTNETVVASGGLKGLFAGTKVTDADLERILPKNNEGKYYLPVTTLTNYCYSNMFEGCTSLTTAPELPATTLVDSCYQYMFYRCSKLNYIKMLATDISANYCLSNWVSGVASSGTFVKHKDMNSLPTSTSSNYYSGIPNGWTVENA